MKEEQLIRLQEIMEEDYNENLSEKEAEEMAIFLKNLAAILINSKNIT